jgi:hypothetical protein
MEASSALENSMKIAMVIHDFYFLHYTKQEVFYAFNGSDDFPTMINMWLSLPSLFTHTTTDVLSLPPIPFGRNDNKQQKWQQ